MLLSACFGVCVCTRALSRVRASDFSGDYIFAYATHHDDYFDFLCYSSMFREFACVCVVPELNAIICVNNVIHIGTILKPS